MKRKMFLLFFFLSMLFSTFASLCRADNEGGADAVATAAPALISRQLSSRAAQNFIDLRANLPKGGFPEWKGAKASEPAIYYSTQGDPSGYCYSIIKGGRDLGYLLLSADESRSPVQEFSRAPAPHKRSAESCRKVARSLIKEGQSLGKPMFIYPPSAGTYFTLFPVYQAQKEVERLVFCSRGLFPLPGDIMKMQSDPAAPQSAKQARADWKLLAEGKRRPPGNCPFQYISGVPIYPYLIFCHPTITGAFLDYLGLRPKTESREDFVAEIAKYLKESEVNGLTIYNIPRRIKEIAAVRGQELQVAVKCRDSVKPEEKISFSDYKDQIDRGNPAILIFSFGPGANKDLAAASAQLVQYPGIGVGYSCDSTGNYLILHESLVNHEQKENIIQGESPYSRTGVVFINWEAVCGNIICVSVSKGKKK